MIYIFAIAILLALFTLTDVRKYAGLLFLAVLVGIATLYLVLEDARLERRELIQVEEVQLLGVVVEQQSSSYNISGRLKNTSAELGLVSFGLKLVALDCESLEPQTGCEVIGEEQEQVFVKVPATQARDFTSQMYFNGGRLSPKGQIIWRTSVTFVEAAR